MKKNLVWIGVRESDIDETGEIFSHSITIYGSGKNGNISMESRLGRRINHNEEIPEYDDFFQQAMYEILSDEPDVRFLQYDFQDSKDFPWDLKQKIDYVNTFELLNFVNDKISFKVWATNYVSTLPCKILSADQLTEESLQAAFPNSKRLVVQRRFSCGGEGTFLFNLDEEYLPQIPLNSTEQCLVTEFQEDNVSINVHVAIYQEEILLFPPSVQLISCERHRLEYIGSDFSAFHALPEKEQALVKSEALRICNALREKGYLGICGVDMILTQENCYFMEINGRFQASSALLNHNLMKNGLPPLQEYHMDAFSHAVPSCPRKAFAAAGSMLVFSYDPTKKDFLNWMHSRLNQSEFFTVCDDALSWTREIQKGSYLFQLRSNNAISSISYQHTTRLHPNAMISPYQLNTTYNYENLIQLKVLLLVRGVSISPAIWQIMQKKGGVDWEEFGAVTIKLGSIWITTPCLEKWHTISPLEMSCDQDGEQIILCYYGKRLFPIEVMTADLHGEKKTKQGHFFKDIVYKNPDRLRVYFRNGCALQDIGLGCKFCDLYGEEKPFGLEEIYEAVSCYSNDSRINHYLIGGGSELDNNQCDSILAIARYLFKTSGKHIYLMSQPINDRDTLNKLRDCGVTEVAFNIEMFDRKIAKKVMPGKARNRLQDYYDALKLAVELWGNTGNVRSAVILGFDSLETFQEGIHDLCSIGVAPILSVFRPCQGTPLENYMPLDEKSTLLYYDSAKSICEEFGMKLGPSCKACQNNTVTLDI